MSHPLGWIALAASAFSLCFAVWARHGIKADRARVDAAHARLHAAQSPTSPEGTPDVGAHQ